LSGSDKRHQSYSHYNNTKNKHEKSKKTTTIPRNGQQRSKHRPTRLLSMNLNVNRPGPLWLLCRRRSVSTGWQTDSAHQSSTLLGY